MLAIRKAIRLLILGILVASCSSFRAYKDISRNVQFETLKFPVQTYTNITRLNDGQIVAFVQNYDHPKQLLYALEGDNELRELYLEQDPKCTAYTEYVHPTALPDRRLGFIKVCARSRGHATVPDITRYVVAYGWESQILEQIVKHPLPDNRLPGYFSWNPDMTRGIQGAEDGLTGINGTLYWLTPEGSEPMQFTLSNGVRSYDLAKSYYTKGEISDGMVSSADWSPDGKWIAFFGSLDVIGKGLSRIDSDRYLYTYSVDRGQAFKAFEYPLYHANNPVWSPDGRKLAFTEGVDIQRSRLWVFDLDSKKLYLVVISTYFGDLTWSADSQEIAVIWQEQPISDHSEIRKYMIDFP